MLYTATTRRPLSIYRLVALGALGSFSSLALACSSDNPGAQGSGGAAPQTGGASQGSGGESSSSGGVDQIGSGGSGSGGSEGSLPSNNYNCEPPEGSIPGLALDIVVDGLSKPVFVTHAPNDPRLFVVEQGGVIRIVNNDVLAGEPLLDITSLVRTSDNEGERGLLGLAFHPRFASNGLFYVHFSASQAGTQFTNGTSVLAEFSMMQGSATVANPDSGRILLTVEQPDINHNGGTVTFGPDGMLYLGLGDGGGGGDTHMNGQNEKTLLGTILRIDPDARDAGSGTYGIPSGNLSDVFPGAAPEIYSYGLRNPFRFNFDVCTNDLYIGDVGQNITEEVNITKNGVGQLNYGWNTTEGSNCFNPMSGCDTAGLTMPLIEYGREVGQYIAVTGGSVYRGSEIPALRGKYLYADSSSNRIWYSEYNREAHTVIPPVDITTQLGARTIVSIQNGNDGEIYMTDLVRGELVKLVVE